MGLSDEGEANVQQRYEELCLDLNMDKTAEGEAWESYQRIQLNYTLEGDQLHWLACALYEACRRTVVPTVGRGQVEGNCVSLTRLLRSAKFSLIQFFNKMKKWSDMASLPQEFRNKVDRLERNFAVSTVIFKKFEPIFLDIFEAPSEISRQQRSRKPRKSSHSKSRVSSSERNSRLPCTPADVFNFAWTMFVQVKGNFPAISDDLVNSYHLLVCCVDWIYANALLGGRKDLLSPEFSGLPDNYHSRDWKPPVEAPCIIQLLCDKHDGLVVEAKTIKEHWWKPHIKKLYEKRILKGKVETLSAILETGNFEVNSKSINNAYEEYVLSVGDFDERIFLGEEAEEEIGTPGKPGTDFAEQMAKKKSLRQHVDQTRSLAPSTPLTGRYYLKDKDPSVTPVSTATQSVSRLQALLSGRRTSPSDTLLEVFGECNKDPKDDIVSRVQDMGEIFCTHYVQPSEGHPGAHIDFARRRLQLGESLYFKMLENIVQGEKKRIGKDQKTNPATSVQGLLEHPMFHRSLLACCLEIVIFSYNSQRTFPWIVDVFEMSSYHLYKVIEICIRAEEGLSRDVVKHLNHIEETILESLAWKRDSPLWDAIQEHSEDIPMCEEVTPANQIDNNSNITSSPLTHPRVKSLVGEGRNTQRTIKVVEPLQSPPGPSAVDRFSSPQPGSVKRQLFGPAAQQLSTHAATHTELVKQLNSGVTDTVVTQTDSNTLSTGQTLIAVTSDGRQVLIPVQTLVSTSPSKQIPPSPSKSNKPKKTGSLPLFFRKVYHLVSVRLRDLCDRLEVTDDDLRRKMWTCFEHVFVHNLDLMKDRHIDQLLMCAIYVMAKVCQKPLTFQQIMKCYRVQPQAQSHVYRSVLLIGRHRNASGSSESSKSGASGSSSPVNKEDEKDRDKKKTEMLGFIRSDSTLPVPHPNSQPPTPTKLLGGEATFDFERGDLIQFYNAVFVKRIKSFALKFSSANATSDVPPLSPLPLVRSQQASPRRVSSKYSVYISPHAGSMSHQTQPKGISFCINRSPAKDLRAINNMVRMGERKLTGKRILEVDHDDDVDDSPSKKMCSSRLMRRLQDVNSERQEANGIVN
ncbi:retinoblastoma-like protein 1 isoform X1 [Haliotis rufescens]|uniref:retinoblastoma-like protein 1 isoform X1 n=1 Tax=Haliotis rufescens TaxID=6454 RepID=UPI001EB0123E|nr:retinoblastoma-like protein 1 isoform X1 [Haliotis rufescens]